MKYKLKSWPVSHENVLAWALKGELVSGSTAKSLLARLEGSRRDLSLLEKWYPPSIDLIPEKYREEFKMNVDKFLSQMTSAEIADTEGLDISDWLSSQDAADARARFEAALVETFSSPSIVPFSTNRAFQLFLGREDLFCRYCLLHNTLLKLPPWSPIPQ